MKLFHVSEEQGIKVFYPRPSPSFYERIDGEVVFAVNEKKLHNYLLPRDCPRVTFCAGNNSSESDIHRFIGKQKQKYIISVDEKWLERIKTATLYLYELPNENFVLLDETAGYYVSYNAVKPLNVMIITDLPAALTQKNVDLRITRDLRKLAEEISSSTLQYSIIRLRNL